MLILNEYQYGYIFLQNGFNFLKALQSVTSDIPNNSDICFLYVSFWWCDTNNIHPAARSRYDWFRHRRIDMNLRGPTNRLSKSYSSYLSRLSWHFAHLYLLSSYFFSFSLLLSSPLLSDSSVLFFSSLHIVGSLTSKLPLIIPFYCHITTGTIFIPSFFFNPKTTPLL